MGEGECAGAGNMSTRRLTWCVAAVVALVVALLSADAHAHPDYVTGCEMPPFNDGDDWQESVADFFINLIFCRACRSSAEPAEGKNPFEEESKEDIF